jgi:hypothetical protein
MIRRAFDMPEIRHRKVAYAWVAEVLNAADATKVELFSGLPARQFKKLVRQLRAEGADPALNGRPWSLAFEERVLLVIAYWRTNLTMRQIAALFGTSKSAVDRIIDDLAPKLALRPRQRFAPRRSSSSMAL